MQTDPSLLCGDSDLFLKMTYYVVEDASDLTNAIYSRGDMVILRLNTLEKYWASG